MGKNQPRKETTELLTEILIRCKLSDRKYYAREVTLDYGTAHTKRVDIMQFMPEGVIYPSDIEKGIFVCYEIKSCKEDIYSGNGLNFVGEKNYIVITMETYKAIQDDIQNGTLKQFLKENHPESSRYYGILVAVPERIGLNDTNALHEEYQAPSRLEGGAENWHLWTAIPCREGPRKRSATELLFCMLRSKHNYTNNR